MLLFTGKFTFINFLIAFLSQKKVEMNEWIVMVVHGK